MFTHTNLAAYIDTVDGYIKTRPDMDAVRAYNHQMIDIFDSLRPLAGKALLDVGASPHGFALEWALQKKVSIYTGIGLGIHEPVEVVGAASHGMEEADVTMGSALKRWIGGARSAVAQGKGHGTSIGRLISMNAESLDLESASFDLIISLSTFEHFFDGAQVLREMHRVLRPGGSMLVSFQPVWTSSYGHHLHHVEPVSRLIPPWAHLLWTEEEMRRRFEGAWPDDLPMSLEQAIEWIYRSNEVNRIDVVEIRRLFRESPFEIEWMTPLMDDESGDKKVISNYLAALLPFSQEDLMTLGYSVLLNRR